jgi:hypothetical protein
MQTMTSCTARTIIRVRLASALTWLDCRAAGTVQFPIPKALVT